MGSGNKGKRQEEKIKSQKKKPEFLLLTFTFTFLLFTFTLPGFCQDVKKPNVAGAFYPKDPVALSQAVDACLNAALASALKEEVFSIIVPHAGYEYSGKVAAHAYRLIENKPYTTVVILGASHHHGFQGVSVYPSGIFQTPLGDVEVDSAFARQLFNQLPELKFDALAFEKEHTLEVQIPFLQKTLPHRTAGEGSGQRIIPEFKIVPVMMGDCTFLTCQRLADAVIRAIGSRKDVLLVASTDMYHGYDYEEADRADLLTNTYLFAMDPSGLYKGLKEQAVQLCGGMPVVTVLQAAKLTGNTKIRLLKLTNSAEVTGVRKKGAWTVGYSSWGIVRTQGAEVMLNQGQRKKVLQIARSSIESYLQTGKKLQLKEDDPLLLKPFGAFVTLRKHGELRGCIGSLTAAEPLYLTIRDMAVESATGDPRFSEVSLKELKEIDIEISVLSPLERVHSADEITLGIHGVIVRRGSRSGVFLPQVAEETQWSKEKFLNNLCSHKAGLPEDAWKDKNTELYIFTAEVFSEKEL